MPAGTYTAYSGTGFFSLPKKYAKTLGLKKVIASTAHFRIFMLLLLPVLDFA